MYVRVCRWVYYSSGSDDEITLRENHNAFHRIWFRPRVMVNVKEIDMSTTILGHKCSMCVIAPRHTPLPFCCAVALGASCWVVGVVVVVGGVGMPFSAFLSAFLGHIGYALKQASTKHQARRVGDTHDARCMTYRC